MSFKMVAVIRYGREVWDSPSLKHAFYLGIFSLLISFLAQAMLDAFYAGDSLKNSPESYDYDADLRTAIMIILVAPLLETLFMQVGVVGLLRAIRVPRKLTVWLSAIIFAFLHFWKTQPSLGVLIQMLPIVPTGYLLAALYYKLLEQDGWRIGFKYTMVAHASHNGVIFVIIWCLALFPD